MTDRAAVERSGPTGSGWFEGRRLRDLDSSHRRVALALAALVFLPFVVAAMSAQSSGWFPSGDEGTMASAARQVVSSHPPLVGEITSAGKYNVQAYHPGPMVYEVLAPFVLVLGATAGMLYGAAIVGGLSLVLIGYTGLRMHGPVGALLAWATALAMSLSVGGSAYLYRPFKTVAAVLPILLALHLCAALVRGELSLLPLWAFAVSYPMAASAQYLIPVGGPAAMTVAVVLVHRVRQGGGLRRLLPRSRRGRTRLAQFTAIVALAWWGPVYDALAHGGGNIVQLYRGAQASGASVGVKVAAKAIARAVVFDPAMTRTAQGERTAVHLAIALALGVAVLVTLIVRRRSLDRATWSNVAVAAVALPALVVALASNPAGEGYAFYRILAATPVAAFVVYAAATVAVRALLPDRSWPVSGRGLAVAAAGVAALSLFTMVPLPVQPEMEDMPWTFAAVPQLADQVEPHLTGSGRWRLAFAGPRSMLVTMSGLASELEARGVDTDLSRPPALGAPTGRVPAPIAGELLVMPTFLVPPGDGWTSVATYVPADRDTAAADAVATELVAEATARPPRPLPVLERSVQTVLCPAVVFVPGRCPDAEAAMASPNPVASLPPAVVAIIYRENFTDVQPFPIIDAAEPSPALVRRLNATWNDLPVTVYLRAAQPA